MGAPGPAQSRHEPIKPFVGDDACIVPRGFTLLHMVDLMFYFALW